jgi:hypothetical protein
MHGAPGRIDVVNGIDTPVWVYHLSKDSQEIRQAVKRRVYEIVAVSPDRRQQGDVLGNDTGISLTVPEKNFPGSDAA